MRRCEGAEVTARRPWIRGRPSHRSRPKGAKIIALRASLGPRSAAALSARRRFGNSGGLAYLRSKVGRFLTNRQGRSNNRASRVAAWAANAPAPAAAVRGNGDNRAPTLDPRSAEP
eukprot:3056950-Pyramimonas_sp.AAC.2